jgi:single-strand DNA-binding protein
MKGRNLVLLQGVTGADVELRYTQSGTAVGNVRLATTDRRKNAAGEYEDVTEWHTLTLWGRTAEIAQEFAPKGTRIDVTGTLRTRNYDDKDGNKRYVTEIHVNDLILLGSKGQRVEAGAGVAEDDLPF